MSYQANNNPGMQGGYFQTPNDFRAQNQGYASSGMRAPGSGYGAAQRVGGGSQGLGSRQGQAPGQGYVQVPSNLQAQNQGYAPGMQAPGSYTSPTGGGVGGGRGGPQGYGQEFPSQGVVGSGYAHEVGRGGQGYGRGGSMQGVGAQQGMQGGGGISNNAVVGPQYCLPQVSSFAVSRKGMSMSRGDLEIEDATGRTVFKVSGSVVTVRDKKFLKDPANTTLLRMQKKVGTQQ
ncbi:unnamed protein product [Sphagnum jensenii]|uniref:Uncharacterized protein n=1 Tax=Sphagnum jensenii TaxID=128206 RepID=A0ABP1BEC8_9BRYO